MKRIALEKNIEKNSYIQLRRATLSYLTIYNRSRGNEVASLTLSRYKDAINDRWVNKRIYQSLNEKEKSVIDRFYVCFKSAKSR